MPAAMFIPAAISTGISAYSAYKNAKTAGKNQKLQGQMLGQGANAAGQQQAGGGELLKTGLPAYQNATNYFQTLLHGNRSQMAQATAGTRAAVTDVYRGAESGINRGMASGPERSLAMRELARDRAAKIAGITTGVQPAAAESLANYGLRGAGEGLSAIGNAGNTFANLANPYGQNARYAQENQREDMSGVGRGIGELFKIWQSRQ